MRHYELIFENETCNVWKITWPSGTGLDWHDHGMAHAEIHLLEGVLAEETDVSPLRVHLGPKRWAVPAGISHKIVNVGMHTAISLHVYTPPLTVEYPDELELTLYGTT